MPLWQTWAGEEEGSRERDPVELGWESAWRVLVLERDPVELGWESAWRVLVSERDPVELGWESAWRVLVSERKILGPYRS